MNIFSLQDAEAPASTPETKAAKSSPQVTVVPPPKAKLVWKHLSLYSIGSTPYASNVTILLRSA